MVTCKADCKVADPRIGESRKSGHQVRGTLNLLGLEHFHEIHIP